MGRTYLTGPPKWTCDNCGRRNTMKKRPSPGHSVQKKCSGCDHYQDVSRPKKDYGKIALVTAVLVAIGAIGPTVLAIPIALVVLWLGFMLLNYIFTHPNITNSIPKFLSKDYEETIEIPKEEYENFGWSVYLISLILSAILLVLFFLGSGFLVALIRMATGYLTSQYSSNIINEFYTVIADYSIMVIIILSVFRISLKISEDKELLKSYSDKIERRHPIIICGYIILSLGIYCLYYATKRSAIFESK